MNYDLGVYTERWKLLFQVQVGPGKTQKYVYTFEKLARTGSCASSSAVSITT